MNPYNGKPVIKERFETINKRNPISGHQWTEQGKTIGYSVHGGGWMPTNFRALKAAEKELALRERILNEMADFA